MDAVFLFGWTAVVLRCCRRRRRCHRQSVSSLSNSKFPRDFRFSLSLSRSLCVFSSGQPSSIPKFVAEMHATNDQSPQSLQLHYLQETSSCPLCVSVCVSLIFFIIIAHWLPLHCRQTDSRALQVCSISSVCILQLDNVA